MFDALQYEYMQNALVAGLLAAVACGIIGTYVIVRRIVFISEGIAHASFGGIGLGYLAGFSPITGALIFSVAAALGIGIVTRKTRLAEDTAIGILLTMGMALGILFIGLAPGYAPDLWSYLFGNILTVPDSDLRIMLVLDLVIVGTVLALYKEFLTLVFDEEFGTVVGIPVNTLYLLLLGMIALTVVLLIRVVGIILVVALLTIPTALARQFTYDLRKIMILSVTFGAAFTLGGLWISYEFDVPSGATIILLGGTALFGYLAAKRLTARRGRTGA